MSIDPLGRNGSMNSFILKPGKVYRIGPCCTSQTLAARHLPTAIPRSTLAANSRTDGPRTTSKITISKRETPCRSLTSAIPIFITTSRVTGPPSCSMRRPPGTASPGKCIRCPSSPRTTPSSLMTSAAPVSRRPRAAISRPNGSLKTWWRCSITSRSRARSHSVIPTVGASP